MTLALIRWIYTTHYVPI